MMELRCLFWLEGRCCYEYTLSTAWDVSTADFDSVSISRQDGDAKRIKFNNDGTKMFVLGRGGDDTVYEYTLSTAFDVSSTALFCS